MFDDGSIDATLSLLYSETAPVAPPDPTAPTRTPSRAGRMQNPQGKRL